MDFEIVKEVCVEYCENINAIVSTFLKKNDNIELEEILNKITFLEDEIRLCKDINMLFNYKRNLEQLMNRIEVIINA